MEFTNIYKEAVRKNLTFTVPSKDAAKPPLVLSLQDLFTLPERENDTKNRNAVTVEYVWKVVAAEKAAKTNLESPFTRSTKKSGESSLLELQFNVIDDVVRTLEAEKIARENLRAELSLRAREKNDAVAVLRERTLDKYKQMSDEELKKLAEA